MQTIFKNIKEIIDNPCILFVFIALIFGNIMLFITPPFEVPDERAHFLRACEIADGIFYNKTPTYETSYDKNFESIVARDKGEFHAGSRNSAIMYIPSSIGIKLGNIFSENSYHIFYLGRFLNLLGYIILCAFAIKITPVFKYPFTFTALLPMALFEGMSYSADSFNNGFAFLFFAFIFKLIFKNKEINKKDFSLLTIFSVVGALCKGLIYPTLLYFFIPKNKKQLGITILLILLCIFISFSWTTINHKNLHPYIEVINNPLFIIEEPLKTINLFANTIINSFMFHIKSAIGILGTLAIHLPQYLYSQYIFVFILMFIILSERIQKRIQIMSFCILVFSYFMILYLQLIYWNSPNTTIINGVQGRYLISILPLLFLTMPIININISEKYKNIFKIFIIIFITISLYTTCNLMYEYYNILGINI